MNFCIGLVMAVFVFFAKDFLIHIFTSIQEVVDYAEGAFSLMSIFMVINGVQIILSGCMRGLGL